MACPEGESGYHGAGHLNFRDAYDAPSGGQMSNSVTIRVPARLHLGFLDPSGGSGRRFGSFGLPLSEPETVATDRIMTVGQAVRREVSAMNEGIERTIARATEAGWLTPRTVQDQIWRHRPSS